MRARRLLMLALVALLFGAPGVAAQTTLVPDERGDVPLAGADVRDVAVARSGAGDVRVTVGYADAIPLTLSVLAILQVGPSPADVVVIEASRAASDRWPEAVVTTPAAEGGNLVLVGRALYADDAVQLVVPAAAFAEWPCLALRALDSAHRTSETPEGTRIVDEVRPSYVCNAPDGASAGATSAAPEESSYALPREARVPAPSLAMVAVALGVALALARVTRRR